MNAYNGPVTAHGQTVLVRHNGQIVLTAWLVRGKLADVPRKGIDEITLTNARRVAIEHLTKPDQLPLAA